MFRLDVKPLEKIRVTQPFGVNWTGDPIFYSKYQLKGHNGIDFSAPNGTPAFAVAGGSVQAFREKTDQGYGLNIRLTVTLDPWTRLEVIYGHLQEILKEGQVAAGEKIALCDNTGDSLGPHLHFGIRVDKKTPSGSWQTQDMNNGFLGWQNPADFMDPAWLKLPVENRYGLTPKTPGIPSEWEFYPAQKFFRKQTGRLMTPLEYNALRYGFWDIRTVLDPAHFFIWSEMTKPEARRRNLIR